MEGIKICHNTRFTCKADCKCTECKCETLHDTHLSSEPIKILSISSKMPRKCKNPNCKCDECWCDSCKC